MNKTPFVTKEQLDEIMKTYPTRLSFMLKREVARM